MEDRFLNYVKRLQAIAATGLAFSPEAYDRERFEEVGAIALAMLGDLANTPVNRIEGLVSQHDGGYVTPKVDVRGAVFHNNEILLVREKSDGLWTLPGGYADVGLSPAENVEKEIQEEAGLQVKTRLLYAVRHKAKNAYKPDVRDFYKLFFLCDCIGESEPAAGAETDDARYFSLGAIPPLSRGRTIGEDLDNAWAFHTGQRNVTVFD